MLTKAAPPPNPSGALVMKTNAARLLDQQKIPYTLLEYPVDPQDLAAERAAEKLGLPTSQVFKTLVVRGDRGGVALAVIPASGELNLKALAEASAIAK